MATPDRFRFTSIAAPASLADVAEAIWTARGTISYGKERILPTAKPVLLINLGSPFRVRASNDPDRHALRMKGWLVGPQTGYVENEPLAETDVVGATLRPWGPMALFDVSGHELRDRIVDLDAIWGWDLDRLRERLHGLVEPGARMALMCRVLTARRTLSPPPKVDLAAHRLALDPASSVSALTSELEISRKHLSALFGRYVGLPPGAFARVHRFNRALQSLALASPPSLAQIALRNGYFDQAHMNRDFAAFGDITPTAYLRQRALHMTSDGDASGLFVPGL
jgi:AraC-like DNA-binding protein